MSSPIGDQLAAEYVHHGTAGADTIRNIWHDITTRYDQRNDPGRTAAMTLADTIKTDLTDGLDYVEGWVSRVKTAAPDVLAHVQKYANSPIMAALEEAGALIDPPAEQIIAGWIHDLASLRPAVSQPAPAAAEPAPAEADPAPAQ